ncbi:hypothetical protein SEUCBS139899_002861 [Sporothrix eucalyptigena]|uniref:Oxidoreductase n=1 Tax=Sporothrix eucalyptigena TaxID=1812306 RepID=A0ABP0BZ05_9PEZI
MSAPIKVGIIGFGLATNCFHLPFILPNKDLEVYAFLQRAAPSAASSQRYGHCTEKFPQAKHYQTAEDFFADPAIELVVVAALNHVAFATQALEAGKHVVVEKPFTATSAEADQLIALAKQKGKILTVFQNRRLDSDFRTVRKLLTEKALGDIKEADIHFDPPSAPWVHNWTDKEYTPGKGNVFELGTHTIDQSLVLFGKPAAVTSFFRAHRGGAGEGSDIHDSFTLVLEYDGPQKDLLVTVKTSIVSVLKDQLRFAVRGTQGTFLKFGTCPQEDRAIAAPGQPADDTYGKEDPRIWGTLTTKDAAFDAVQKKDDETGYYIGKYPSLPGNYCAYYDNIVQAIRGTAPLDVDPQTSRDGIRLIELARKSHEAKATVPWTESD